MENELDEILSQAFTDGASDTMWQNDRHIEIFATAKDRLNRLMLTREREKLVELAENIKKYDWQLEDSINANDAVAETVDFELGKAIAAPAAQLEGSDGK